MSEGPLYRTLKETGEYSAQIESLAQRYSDSTIESALLGVLWGIATNPTQYDQTTWNIRVAKSRAFSDDAPLFKIFFEVVDDSTVQLLWIEEIGGTEEILGS